MMRPRTEWFQSPHVRALLTSATRLTEANADSRVTFADNHEKVVNTEAIDAVFAESVSASDYALFSDDCLFSTLNRSA
jgi:hypothetical protein